MTPEELTKAMQSVHQDMQKAFADMWALGFSQGMEKAAKICDYREDLQIKTCGEDRAIEAKSCAEAIREAKDKS